MSILNLFYKYEKTNILGKSKDLTKKDKKLGKIISTYPKDFLFSKSDPFYTLARSIVGQQISVQAALTVWNKCEKDKKINPENTIKMHFMTLKSLRSFS